VTSAGQSGRGGQEEQGVLPGMPQRLFSCTPTKLAAFEDCPRRYRFSYLDRPSPPRGPAFAHTSVGAAVHNALARWWDEPLARRTAQRAAELVAGAWTPWTTAGFRDAAQSEEHRRRCQEAVAAYAERLDPTAEPVGVERTVAAPTQRLAFSGRVDRIDRRPREDGDGDEPVVVDYKLGRRVPEDDDARSSMALGLYAVAVSRTLRARCRRVELHHVPTGAVAVAEHTDASLERVVRRAESIASDAVRAQAALDAGADRDEAFPATPSALCSWCDFRPSCPTGQRSAPAKETWAALEPLA